MNLYNQSYDLATTPIGRDKKVGWYKRHNNPDMLAKRLHLSMLLIGDSIVADLSRYKTVWNKQIKRYKALNCGIPGDRTQHVLRRAEDLSVPPSLKYVVVHCGTNNLNHDEPTTIVDGIIEISKGLPKKIGRRR